LTGRGRVHDDLGYHLSVRIDQYDPIGQLDEEQLLCLRYLIGDVAGQRLPGHRVRQLASDLRLHTHRRGL
jgi:hypothetical protein